MKKTSAICAGGEQIDLLLTDPPYNVAYEGKTSEKLKIENDKMSDENFIQFLTSAFKNAYKALKKGGAFYIWHAIMNCNSLIVACQNANLQPRQILIWNKNRMVMGRQDYHGSTNFAYMVGKMVLGIIS